jgi:hypothetical protein
MSTFGRKSLVWWDYENRSKENAIRFNHSPMDIQLSILEKWYPIGTKCNYMFSIHSNITIYPSVISRYEKCSSYYRIVVSQRGIESSASPFKLKISPDDIKRIKRESKLSKLGF